MQTKCIIFGEALRIRVKNFNQSIKSFILEKKMKIALSDSNGKRNSRKGRHDTTTSVKTCDMKVEIHTKNEKNNSHGRDT